MRQMIEFEIKTEAIPDRVTIRPDEMAGLPGCQLGVAPSVASAPGFAGEPLRGKAKCPFAYGIESINGMCNCVSSWSGRLTVRFNTKPLSNASAMPKASPPPASAHENLIAFLGFELGGDGRWTALMLGILDGSKASSIACLFERCREVFVIRFVHLLASVPSLQFAEPAPKASSFSAEYLRSRAFSVLESLPAVPATWAFADCGLFADDAGLCSPLPLPFFLRSD